MFRESKCVNYFLNREVLQQNIDAAAATAAAIKDCRKVPPDINYINNETLLPVKPKRAWTEEDWKHQHDLIERLSKPREAIVLPPIRRKKKPINKLMPTVSRLAKPLHRIPWNMLREDAGKPVKINSSINMKRIECLAQPRVYPVNENIDPCAGIIKASALKYVPNSTIKRLSLPKEFPKSRIKMEFKTLDEALTINPKAFKYKASKRTKQLARPKKRFTLFCEDKPPKRPKKGLSKKAKLSLIRKMNLRLPEKNDPCQYCSEMEALEQAYALAQRYAENMINPRCSTIPMDQLSSSIFAQLPHNSLSIQGA